MDDDLVVRNGFGEIKYLKPEDIVIGKTYRVRSWEDISENFPNYKGFDNIFYCPDDPKVAFVDGMKPLCGCPFTVKNFRSVALSSGPASFLDSEEGIELKNDENYPRWEISSWMLEEIEDDPCETEIESLSDSDLSDFLFS